MDGDVTATAQQAVQAPVEAGAAPPERPKAGPLSVGRCLSTLVVGLLPLVGLVFCLVWSYGGGYATARRNLAKAILWLHGFAVVAAIVGLCVWVLVLANRYSLFSSPVL